MNILITGGTGFIGKALINNLNNDHYKIFVLSRNPQKYINNFDKNVSLLQWDGKTSDGWGNIIENIDAVINLAGENIAGNSFSSIFLKRYTPERKRLILQSRINSGNALVQAIKSSHKKPQFFIQASAVGYYGNRGDEILTESSPPGKDFVSQICIPWEKSTAELDTMNIRRVIIRTAGMVLGNNGGALPFLVYPYRFYLGGPLGSGKQWVSWIHIEDEIRVIRYLLDNQKAEGVFNCSSPNPIINREFSRAIGKILNRPSWLPLPEMVFNLFLGEKAKILLASQRQIPEKLLKLGFEFSYPDIESALKNIFL
ncbi:MAG: TIGR01777 family protein [Chloroflexi bacterium]|nr:TIGR01777 family protein [Chloroflexota bacterium]